jgi:hypothetical protein
VKRANMIAALTLLAASLVSGLASAAPRGDKGCLATFKNGQRLEAEAHLRDAQEQYQTCAKSSCGAFIKQQCSLRYSQLENDIPSVVPVAMDAGGNPLAEVKVTVDGLPLATRIDGRSLQIDPGLHEFSFQTAGGARATQRALIMQGQRNRPITVELNGAIVEPTTRPPRQELRRAAMIDSRPAVETAAGVTVDRDPLDSEDPAPSRPARRTRVAPWILGGAGLAAVGGYALLTFWGRKDNQLLGECTPQCPQASVDRVKHLYLAANISLGVGAAALAGATYLFVRSRSRSSGEEVAIKPASYAVDVQPVPSGAVASLRGAF